ncbi:MAG: arginine repressor, partial [Eubacteriales bacterium]|nr:arginine repressor [Eubacteriales bacterium]
MKFQRQTKILELIEKEPLETQEELSARLREAGFDTTQATVSRDIKELRLIKVMTADGTYRYATAAAEQEGGMQTRVRRIFRESVTSVAVAQNMVVIKTLPGLASAAGYAI